MDETRINEETIHEGKVTIKVPHFDKVSAKAPVFYNPVMELNRDISIAAITVFSQDADGISICDSFGGTGIRGIRYSKEIEKVRNVVITDLNPLAVQFAEKNIEDNGTENVNVYREDANLMLRKCRGKFDVVDIDPFGTPSPYIESAAAGLRAGGMICATATDTSALCGTYTEPCIRKYGSMPLKTDYCHENGIRILAGFMARTFAKYKKFIEVKFSHSTEHYMRIYATVGKGAKNTDESLKNLGYIAHCDKCLKRIVFNGLTPQIPDKCPECGGKLRVGGPLWCGTIINRDFTGRMIESLDELDLNKEAEVLKLFETCYREAEAPIGYYDIHKVCKNLKISSPPLLDVLERIEEEGYFVSRTHFSPVGIKTDADISELKRIVLDVKDSVEGSD